jgi:hypothetical protein
VTPRIIVFGAAKIFSSEAMLLDVLLPEPFPVPVFVVVSVPDDPAIAANWLCNSRWYASDPVTCGRYPERA